MSQKQLECKSLKLDCEECGAEVVITSLYAPPFRDLSPTCPYCHFPLTTRAERVERIESLTTALSALTERADQIRAEIADVREDAA